MILKKNRVAVLGGGSWGSTISLILSKKVREIILWEKNEKNYRYLLKNRCPYFFRNLKLPENVKITNILEDVLDVDFYTIVVPSFAVRGVLRELGNRIDKGVFLSAVKGFEISSFKRISEIVKEEVKDSDVSVLSGPTHAEEVARKKVTSCVIAGKKISVLKELQEIFSSSFFRPYINTDIAGVELAGALKNIIAIASGISDGLNLGINSKSALITRGLAEIVRLGIKFGAKKETFMGLAGIGDLMTTCFSNFSRNRNLGEYIGKGYKLKDALKKVKMTAEGIYTCKAVEKISKIYDIDMPISIEVYKMLYKNKKPEKSLKELMKRELKMEFYK